MNNNELKHHGILGQKWGIRRYQNYDGSYTQAGVRRYNKSKETYDSAKNKLSSAKISGNKYEIRKARGEVKTAKRQMNRNYKKLAQDKMADKGKELYRQGKTITGNAKIATIREAAIVVGANVAGAIIANKTGNLTVASASAFTIAVGGSAVNSILGVKEYSENKKLRAYYAHSK